MAAGPAPGPRAEVLSGDQHVAARERAGERRVEIGEETARASAAARRGEARGQDVGGAASSSANAQARPVRTGRRARCRTAIRVRPDATRWRPRGGLRGQPQPAPADGR